MGQARYHGNLLGLENWAFETMSGNVLWDQLVLDLVCLLLTGVQGLDTWIGGRDTPAVPLFHTIGILPTTAVKPTDLQIYALHSRLPQR